MKYLHEADKLRVDNGVETLVEVTELPIRWEPEYDLRDKMAGWGMFIPQVVDGQELGGIAFDITVTVGGLLRGMGAPTQFPTPEDAKRYAETTFNLQDNDNVT